MQSVNVFIKIFCTTVVSEKIIVKTICIESHTKYICPFLVYKFILFIALCVLSFYCFYFILFLLLFVCY